MKTKYALQTEKEDMAKAYASNIAISTKVGIEIANHLRGRTTKKAKEILQNVLIEKEAIPYKRFNDSVGHRTGIGPGRYPKKASAEFLSLIKQAEANAQNKGLDENLKIVHLVVNKASQPARQGRRTFKRAHVEIAVQEMEKESKK